MSSGSLKLLLACLLMISIWEAAYRGIGWRSYLFPAPSQVLDASLDMLGITTYFGEPVREGWPLHGAGGADALRGPSAPIYRSALATAVRVSAARLAIGFVLSIALGSLLGLGMWRWQLIDDVLGPISLGLQTLPSVCWVPLAILVFGYSERGILFVLIMGSCFAIAIALRDGLRVIPPIYQRAGLMLGAKGWRLYRYVLFPASLPALTSSLRQGFSFAWRSLMGAELLFTAVGALGLGMLLDRSRNLSDVARVVAIMGVMVLLGMLADRYVFGVLERRVHRRFGLVRAD